MIEERLVGRGLLVGAVGCESRFFRGRFWHNIEVAWS